MKSNISHVFCFARDKFPEALIRVLVFGLTKINLVLYLYTKCAKMSGEGSPASKVPSSAAGPEQVRQFIEGVLISKHELSRKDAADSAKRWGIGCGSELREGNEEIFTSKFGVCDGRSLYRTICEKKLNEWENSVLGKLYYCRFASRNIDSSHRQ